MSLELKAPNKAVNLLEDNTPTFIGVAVRDDGTIHMGMTSSLKKTETEVLEWASSVALPKNMSSFAILEVTSILKAPKPTLYKIPVKAISTPKPVAPPAYEANSPTRPTTGFSGDTPRTTKSLDELSSIAKEDGPYDGNF